MERTETCRNCMHKVICKIYDRAEEGGKCTHFEMDTKEFVLFDRGDGIWDRKKDPYGVVEVMTEGDWEHMMKIIEGQGWKRADKNQLPKDGEHVLMLVNGRHGKVRFVNAVLLGYWYEDEGWIIEGYETAMGLRVDWWAEIPSLPMEVE